MSIVCHNYALYSIHKPERKTGFGFMDTKWYCEFITCPHYIPKKKYIDMVVNNTCEYKVAYFTSCYRPF